MGQAPATDRISLRTVPRNFPGRSGTREDQVYLCSPETATASALTGRITDPRTLKMKYPEFHEPEVIAVNRSMLSAPELGDDDVPLEKGPNIQALPDFDSPPETIEGPVLLKVGDNTTTDEIMPAGAEVLPFRSNIPKISEFVFRDIDSTYARRALDLGPRDSMVVAGRNYGQGSSREHAALAPRFLGLRVVLARSFARIHRQNLVNFGILPLVFVDPSDFERIERDDILLIEHLQAALRQGDRITVRNRRTGTTFETDPQLSDREVAILLEGGLINHLRRKLR
jgi:aconitate hydratase